MRLCAFCLLLAVLVACATPRVQEPGTVSVEPRLNETTFTTRDGVDLPYQSWGADNPRAIVIGLHGMNDYSKTFAMPGPWFAEKGIATFAYDQRGFGRAPHTGIWAGNDTLRSDARTFIRLVHDAYPQIPLYVLGVSMGGAVAMTALAENPPAEVEGLILVAPAVWGWSVMNPFYKLSLWLTAHTFPGFSPDGSGLGITPSDNIEMLRDNYRDELMIKGTRSDAIYGLVGLMDEGYLSVAKLSVPTLVVYGEKDEIIPREPLEEILGRIQAPRRSVLYAEGYHMLLRDLQREVVWADLAAWMDDPTAKFPSGEEWILSDQATPSLSNN